RNVTGVQTCALPISFKTGNPDGMLIAVTQLTSMGEDNVKDEQKSVLTLEDSVKNYVGLARAAGLDGVVSSPLEAEMIHAHCGGRSEERRVGRGGRGW